MLKDNVKNLILNILGIFYVILGFASILNTIVSTDSGIAPILWFCYGGVLLIGIGILARNDLLVLSQFNILAIPLLVWVIDFLYIYFTGNSLLGITNYFFIDGPLLGKIISSQHLFTIPLVIYSLYLLKIKNNYAYIVSFIEISILFVFSRMFGSVEENINCVFKPCMNLEVFSYYPLAWFAGFFVIIGITNFLIMRLDFFREK